jgi:hypothetical protein
MTLKVIGAGFGRTGTASLKMALEKLLGGPCYHMSEVLGKPGQVDLWLDVVAGKPDWPAIFGDYEATVDFPACTYWRELADFYPDAKIVLSVRDAERWFESTQKTIFSKRMQGYQTGTKWGGMAKATIDDHVGGDLNDKDAVIGAYEAHNAAVKAAFGPERLLVFEAKDGWEPLCEFLDKPVPDEPYPNINSSAEFESVWALFDSPISAAVRNGEGIQQGPSHEEMFTKN